MGSPNDSTLKRRSVEALTGQRIGPGSSLRAQSSTQVSRSNRYIATSPKKAAAQLMPSLVRGLISSTVHEHFPGRHLCYCRRTTFAWHPVCGSCSFHPSGFAVSAIEASNAGQKSLEHFYGIPFAPDDPSVPEMLAAFRRNGTWVCPTLIVFWNRAHLKELNADRTSLVKRAAPSLVSFWDVNEGISRRI